MNWVLALFLCLSCTSLVLSEENEDILVGDTSRPVLVVYLDAVDLYGLIPGVSPEMLTSDIATNIELAMTQVKRTEKSKYKHEIQIIRFFKSMIEDGDFQQLYHFFLGALQTENKVFGKARDHLGLFIAYSKMLKSKGIHQRLTIDSHMKLFRELFENYPTEFLSTREKKHVLNAMNDLLAPLKDQIGADPTKKFRARVKTGAVAAFFCSALLIPGLYIAHSFSADAPVPRKFIDEQLENWKKTRERADSANPFSEERNALLKAIEEN